MKLLTSLLFFMVATTATAMKDQYGNVVLQPSKNLISAIPSTNELGKVQQQSLGVHLPIKLLNYPKTKKSPEQSALASLHQKKLERKNMKLPAVDVLDKNANTEDKSQEKLVPKMLDEGSKTSVSQPNDQVIDKFQNPFDFQNKDQVYFDLADDPDHVILENGEIVPRLPNMPIKQASEAVSDEDYDEAEEFPSNKDYVRTKNGVAVRKRRSPKPQPGQEDQKENPEKEITSEPQITSQDQKEFYDVPGEPDQVILADGQIVPRPKGTRPILQDEPIEEEVTDEEYDNAEEFDKPNGFLKGKNGKIIRKRPIQKPQPSEPTEDSGPNFSKNKDVDENQPRRTQTGEEESQEQKVSKPKRRIVVAFHVVDCGKCLYDIDRDRFLKLIQQ